MLALQTDARLFNMKPHEERVVKEAEELEEKINKLDNFIKSALFESLPDLDQGLLATQLSAMFTYYGILVLRIEKFDK